MPRPPRPVSSPLPPPEALIDVLNRLSDPAVPGADKIGLVELATADDAAALDKFGKALADNGALPLTFEAVDLKWSETEAGNVVATVNVTTANKPPGKFSFPMEFTPVRDGWQLTRKTADLLLDFGARGDRPVASSVTTGAMWIGWLEFDLLLGDVHSLKQKRSAVRPVIAELQRRFGVSAAETGSQQLHRRAGVGLAVVSGDRTHVVDVLDAAERLVAAQAGDGTAVGAARACDTADDD